MNVPVKPDKARTAAHVAAARFVLRDGGNVWVAVGHLAEAELSIAGSSCELMTTIREERHKLEKGGAANFDGLTM